MKKKIFILSMTLILLLGTTTISFATEENNEIQSGETVYYQISEEQYNNAINIQVLEALEAAILEDNGYTSNFKVNIPLECYNPISLDAINYVGDVEILNNNNTLVTYGGGAGTSYEYRTYLHKDKAKLKAGPYKYASNQLEGGYKGAKTLYYNPSGGGKYSIGISFSAPWSPVSVSASRGIGSNKDIGMNVPTTSTKVYNKVQAKKTYKGTPYSLQKRKKGTKTWTTFKRGVATKYYRVAARCVTVK